MSALALVFVLMAAPPPTTHPPSPKAAARASMRSTLPPRTMPPRRGERTWLPSTYSLSRDPGFTPWTSFFSLGDGLLGHWSMEGTSTGGGLRCYEDRSGCVPFSEAIAALVWQPRGTPLGIYGGLSVASVPDASGMNVAPGPTFGLRLTPPSLAALVRRARAR
jgi:hypothetical protein